MLDLTIVLIVAGIIIAELALSYRKLKKRVGDMETRINRHGISPLYDEDGHMIDEFEYPEKRHSSRYFQNL